MRDMTRNIRYFVTIIVLIFVGDMIVENGLKSNKNIKVSYVSQGGVDADILFHGPCEVIWTIDPDIVSEVTGKKVYNLSEVHTDFADNYLSLYQYLKNNKKPEKLLLFVTPESMDERFNTFYSHYYAPFAKDSVLASVISEMDTTYSYLLNVPLLRYTYHNRVTLFSAFQGIKHDLTNKKEPYFANGYVPPKEMVWDNHYEELYKLYPNGVEFEWSEMREKYLKKIIELCAQDEIELILYESPILKESTKHQYNRIETLNRIKRLAENHSIEYWIYENDSLCMDKVNFFSALNLNMEAGKVFSRKIGARVSR